MQALTAVGRGALTPPRKQALILHQRHTKSTPTATGVLFYDNPADQTSGIWLSFSVLTFSTERTAQRAKTTTFSWEPTFRVTVSSFSAAMVP